jgi:hypothetical protein
LVDKTWSNTDITRCVTYVRGSDVLVVADYINAAKVKVPKKKRPNYQNREITQRWQIGPGIGVEGVEGQLTLVSGDQRVDVIKAGAGDWNLTSATQGSSIGEHTTDWGVKAPGTVMSRSTVVPRTGEAQVLVTVFVPRGSAESVPVAVGEGTVTITRNGVPVTVGFPAP